MRYYGGKWKIADWIISHFPPHRCYVEAFGGAGSVLMNKEPARVEIYNDLSSEVVNLFRVLRCPEKSAELRLLLDLTPYSRVEWKSAYELADDEVEQARRTIVLATMSHNPSKSMSRKPNGFRVSSSGWHQLPQQLINYTSIIHTFTARLKECVIENRDAIEVMRQHDRPSTLHYVDPPYLGSLRADRRNMYQEEMFTYDDHARLAATLRELKGFVILSGYPCKEYNELYEGWTAHSKKTVTGAAKSGESHATEVIWLNPHCAAAQRVKTLF